MEPIPMSSAGADIEALVFEVLLQASRDADDDLRAIVAELEAQAAARRRQRELLCRLAHEHVDLGTDTATIRDDIAAQLDALNELSEMTSMRLQMAMDRRSKFVEALSNLLKKISDTEDSIVKNLK